jgi:hypothetical protein
LHAIATPAIWRMATPTMNTIDAMNRIQLLRVSPMAAFNTTKKQSGSGLWSELRNPDGECGMPDHSARLLRVSAAGILLRRCSKQAVLHDQNNKSDCDYGQH